MARDAVRLVQECRKQSGLNVEDRIVLAYEGEGGISIGPSSNRRPIQRHA